MEKYYVKAPISGWHEVNKEHFEAFVGNMRKHSTPPTMTIDELIASKTRIVETGGKPVARDWPPAPEDGRPEKGRMCMSYVEKIERQQAKEKGRTAAWMVGEQLKDMARREPESAELLDKDLDIPEMSIQQAEKKIKAYADAHKTGSFACVTPFRYQNLLLFTPFNPEADSPYGVSMLRSMPFLCGILLKIYQSLGINWERAGNVRFAVVYKPQGDALDRFSAQERAQQIASQWSEAMQSGKSGSVRDFVAVGDVDIKVIGADNQILDSEVPVRQILEQLIARTGIPPFLLGLNWSTTERMSAQQADLMTSELNAIRRTVTPVIEKICRMWLNMHGYATTLTVEWETINLQDEVEEAKAALYLAQRDKIYWEEGKSNEDH